MRNSNTNTKKFRQLLKNRVTVLPGAYDALSAHLIKQAGFKACFITGAGLSVSYLGRPDIGLLTRDDIVATARRIAAAVDIPFISDADTGFGGPAQVAKTVRELEKAGAAAIQIEDQIPAKRCGHLGGKKVIPTAQMVAKIKAAVAARRDKNFCIVGRTDARDAEGLESAIRRAEAYKKAGADIIFPEALTSKAEFQAFGRKKGLGVLLGNMTEFGRSPALTVNELSHLGFRLVLFPMTAFRVAAHAMEGALNHLRSAGETKALIGRMQTRAELYKLINYTDFK